MWQNFVHLKIESNLELPLDEFKFLSRSNGKDITNEIQLDKTNT